jgi:hypothetical protein
MRGTFHLPAAVPPGRYVLCYQLDVDGIPLGVWTEAIVDVR